MDAIYSVFNRAGYSHTQYEYENTLDFLVSFVASLFPMGPRIRLLLSFISFLEDEVTCIGGQMYIFCTCELRYA